MKNIYKIVKYNFMSWHKNPRIILCFTLAFILCFLLSNKIVNIALTYQTTIQISEVFIWTFGDANSILFTSMLLILLFADIPFVTNATPFYLMRINRKTWILGQVTYIFCVTFIYLIFILLATSLMCMSQSFVGNMWSETSAILGYSGMGLNVQIPALVRVLESGSPFECMSIIFILMFLYTLLLSFIMLIFSLYKNQMTAVIAVFSFSLYGFLLNPENIKEILGLSDSQMYIANVLLAWVSPLNHATYAMHNFGYDLLPSILQTCLIFLILILILFSISLKLIKNYNFNFSGT